MKILKRENPSALKTAVQLLRANKIIISPGDTIYGILGRVPDTESRIRAVKGRGEDKPFIVLAPSAGHAEELCGTRVPPRLARYWPGPLTIILPTAEGNSMGIRVPDDQFLLKMLQNLKKPVYSTSVNRAGEPPMNNIGEIISSFSGDVDLIIDGGDMQEKAASTIVDARTATLRILRQGSLLIDL